jgi:hypothetical protein
MTILAKYILLAVQAPLSLDDARGIVEIFVEYYICYHQAAPMCHGSGNAQQAELVVMGGREIFRERDGTLKKAKNRKPFFVNINRLG